MEKDEYVLLFDNIFIQLSVPLIGLAKILALILIFPGKHIFEVTQEREDDRETTHLSIYI